MKIGRAFIFKGQLCNCNVFIDISPDPCFIFVELKEINLIKKFGKELTIKTDFEKLLEDVPESLELIELKIAIFNSIYVLPDFVHAKQRLNLFNQVERSFQVYRMDQSNTF